MASALEVKMGTAWPIIRRAQRDRVASLSVRDEAQAGPYPPYCP